MLNNIVLMGRMVADPELKTTQSGLSVCAFRIAVDRDYSGKNGSEKQTDFIDVVTWRQTAEFVSRYFSKGKLIIVNGSLQSRKWEDKDGNNRVAWEVNADSVYFGGDSKSESRPAQGRTQIAQAENSNSDSFEPLPDYDLPF